MADVDDTDARYEQVQEVKTAIKAAEKELYDGDALEGEALSLATTALRELRARQKTLIKQAVLAAALEGRTTPLTAPMVTLRALTPIRRVQRFMRRENLHFARWKARVEQQRLIDEQTRKAVAEAMKMAKPPPSVNTAHLDNPPGTIRRPVEPATPELRKELLGGGSSPVTAALQSRYTGGYTLAQRVPHLGSGNQEEDLRQMFLRNNLTDALFQKFKTKMKMATPMRFHQVGHTADKCYTSLAQSGLLHFIYLTLVLNCSFYRHWSNFNNGCWTRFYEFGCLPSNRNRLQLVNQVTPRPPTQINSICFSVGWRT